MYVGLTAILTIISFFLETVGNSYLIILFVSFGAMFVDMMFLIDAVIIIFKITTTMQPVNEKKFKKAKEWFCMCLGLHGIVIFIWTIEIISWVHLDAQSFSHPDLTKLFAAIHISMIFIERKSVKKLIFEKFRR